MLAQDIGTFFAELQRHAPAGDLKIFSNFALDRRQHPLLHPARTRVHPALPVARLPQRLGQGALLRPVPCWHSPQPGTHPQPAAVTPAHRRASTPPAGHQRGRCGTGAGLSDLRGNRCSRQRVPKPYSGTTFSVPTLLRPRSCHAMCENVYRVKTHLMCGTPHGVAPRASNNWRERQPVYLMSCNCAAYLLSSAAVHPTAEMWHRFVSGAAAARLATNIEMRESQSILTFSINPVCSSAHCPTTVEWGVTRHRTVINNSFPISPARDTIVCDPLACL